MYRNFTVQALTNCDLLLLSLKEIDQMKLEFPEIFIELFSNAYKRLRKYITTKLDALKVLETSNNSSHLRSSRVV